MTRIEYFDPDYVVIVSALIEDARMRRNQNLVLVRTAHFKTDAINARNSLVKELMKRLHRDGHDVVAVESNGAAVAGITD